MDVDGHDTPELRMEFCPIQRRDIYDGYRAGRLTVKAQTIAAWMTNGNLFMADMADGAPFTIDPIEFEERFPADLRIVMSSYQAMEAVINACTIAGVSDARRRLTVFADLAVSNSFLTLEDIVSNRWMIPGIERPTMTEWKQAFGIVSSGVNGIVQMFDKATDSTSSVQANKADWRRNLSDYETRIWRSSKYTGVRSAMNVYSGMLAIHSIWSAQCRLDPIRYRESLVTGDTVVWTPTLTVGREHIGTVTTPCKMRPGRSVWCYVPDSERWYFDGVSQSFDIDDHGNTLMSVKFKTNEPPNGTQMFVSEKPYIAIDFSKMEGPKWDDTRSSIHRTGGRTIPTHVVVAGGSGAKSR